MFINNKHENTRHVVHHIDQVLFTELYGNLLLEVTLRVFGTTNSIVFSLLMLVHGT